MAYNGTSFPQDNECLDCLDANEDFVQDWCIFDIDGCLSNDDHRAHFARRKDWDAYHSAASEDVPRRAERFLMRMLRSRGFKVAIITGRPEGYFDGTHEWLIRNELYYDMLLMRPALDRRPSSEVKMRHIVDHFCSNLGRRIILAVDDDPRIIDVYRARGIPVLHSVSEAKWRT